jgi:REP element-mobilizing transposase RayT
MPTGYQIINQSAPYFLTFTVVDWVDIFSRKIYKDIIIDSLDFCRKSKGLKIWAYVIMTNHIHCMLSASNNDLSNVVRDFKRYTAVKILDTIRTIPESRRDWMLKRFEFASRRSARNSHYQFWLNDNHAIEINTPQFLIQKMKYIHENPVRAGFVINPGDWVYGSMRNYLGLHGILEIDISDHYV